MTPGDPTPDQIADAPGSTARREAVAPADLAAVQQVLARYGHLADNGDHDRLTEVFAPDVVFETAAGLRIDGLAALIEAISAGTMPDHTTGNTIVRRGADDELESWSRYLAVDVDGQVTSGEYLDRFVATPAGWRIAHRRANRRRPSQSSGQPDRSWYGSWRAGALDATADLPTRPERQVPLTAAGPADGDLLVIGDDRAQATTLAAALGADLVAAPTIASGEPLTWPWRDDLAQAGERLADGPRHRSVVVCTWEPTLATGPLAELDIASWSAAVEAPLARWFAVVRAAARRCEDGGSLTVVVERPAALDTAGHAPVTAVAEGLIALTRSISMTHGDRGVRANVVTTEVSTAPEVLLGSKPPLGAFPGSVGREVAGAVRMLASPDAVGVTGTVVRADCGRSWA